MKDKLIDTLQERFAHHEMGVDPGTWNAISSQLAAANGSALSEVLKDKFSGHEAPVDPQVWDSISSQLGHGAAAGGSVAAGWWAGGMAAALLVGGLFWWSTDERPEPVVPPATATSVPAEVHTIVPEVSAANVPVPQAATPQVLAEQPQQKKPMVPSVPATSTPLPPAGQEVVSTVWQELVKENSEEPRFSDRVETVPLNVAPPVQLPAPSVAKPIPAPAQPNAAPTTDQLVDMESDMDTEAEPEFVQVQQQPQIYIPNVFSPQGDGVNDRLKVVGSNYQKVLVRIFSAQSNALVFRADNLDDQWNGRDMNNVPCPEGYYFYAIEVTGTDGNTASQDEVVKLFR
jgi:gliding motility-associated-like protein